MPKDNGPEHRRPTTSDATPQGTWVDRELAGCDFKDERLGKRLRSLLEQLSSSPGDSIPLVCQDWANTKAAYRFFDNDRVSEAEILGGHFGATRDRVSATSGPILLMHDTTEFTYKREDIEAVGKTRINFAGAYRDGSPRLYTACGILLHSSLAVTPEGLPLGLTAIKFWSRKKFKGANSSRKHGMGVIEAARSGNSSLQVDIQDVTQGSREAKSKNEALREQRAATAYVRRRSGRIVERG